MIDAHRLTLGNGQSYQDVSVLTAEEIVERVNPIFGDSTFCFVQRIAGEVKFTLVHACTVRVIHLTKLWHPVLEDSIPYEKVVLSLDSVYGPGQLYLPHHHWMFGLEPFVIPECKDFIPFLFSTNSEGLLLINAQSIATLECRAACDKLPSKHVTPQRLKA